jgi:hypothetical protein
VPVDKTAFSDNYEADFARYTDSRKAKPKAIATTRTSVASKIIDNLSQPAKDALISIW